MKKLVMGVVVWIIGVAVAQAAIVEQQVDYRAGDTVMKGYLVYDEAKTGPRPGVLVVHEWWGLNDYARQRARMLAELGYTALAVDMYGEGKLAQHPQDAQALSSHLGQHQEIAQARFNAALALLRQQVQVDDQRIAAIGYCFGGSVVLEMARAGIDLAGVASFHGGLGTSQAARPGDVRTPVLVLTGADDPFVPEEQVEAFEQEMTAAGVSYQLISYLGAMHSFTSPAADQLGKEFNLPLAYNRHADEASWQELQDFFKTIFK